MRSVPGLFLSLLIGGAAGCGDGTAKCGGGATCGDGTSGAGGVNASAGSGVGVAGATASAGATSVGGSVPVGGGGTGGTGGASTGGTVSGGSGGAGVGGSVGDLSAPPGSAVYTHGKLSVVGKELRNQSGNVVQLKGVSSMWLNWEDDGYAESLDALRWLRDNWKVQVVRAAMGVEPAGAYLEDSAKAKAQVDKIVQNAVALGLYVIIDWHDHEALSHQAQAEAFFDEVAGKYGQTSNVLYEPFNEPLDVSWSSQLKPFHQALVTKIRAKDPDNVIILGTPNWSQDVEVAAADPVPGTNLLYTLHFYACTHTDWLQEKATEALNLGAPLFVTEWGATHADGGLDGVVCTDEANAWHTFMKANHISWTSWKLDGCEDASCLFKEGAPENGGFGDEWLQGHGPFVRDRLKE